MKVDTSGRHYTDYRNLVRGTLGGRKSGGLEWNEGGKRNEGVGDLWKTPAWCWLLEVRNVTITD